MFAFEKLICLCEWSAMEKANDGRRVVTVFNDQWKKVAIDIPLSVSTSEQYTYIVGPVVNQKDAENNKIISATIPFILESKITIPKCLICTEFAVRNINPEPAHDIRMPIRSRVFLLTTFNKYIAVKVYAIEENAIKNLRSKCDFLSVNLKVSA